MISLLFIKSDKDEWFYYKTIISYLKNSFTFIYHFNIESDAKYVQLLIKLPKLVGNTKSQQKRTQSIQLP